LVWFALVGLVACGDNGANAPAKIQVTPSSVMLPVGDTSDVVASYLLEDGTLTPAADVTWTVDNASIAMVTPGADGHATIRAGAAGTTTLTVTGKGATGTVDVTITPPVLRSLAITPTAPMIAAGTSMALTATGTYSDKTTANLSAMVTWSSSATAVATVDATGSLKGLTVGSATITAKLGAISGTTGAMITSALLTEIQVTPTNPSLPLGTTQQLIAMGVFTDTTTQDLTTQVTWASDATGHVTVTTGGLVTAAGLGTANLTATMNGVTGSTKVTAIDAVLVSIALSPLTPSVAKGRSVQLKATGTFTDHSTKDLSSSEVTWASSDEAIATVSASGLVTTLTGGNADITATSTLVNTISGSTTVMVTNAVIMSIDVTPVNPSVALGHKQQFKAVGTFTDGSTLDITTDALWETDATTIAQISNAAGSKGLATTLALGSTTVSATLDGVPGSTSLMVTDAVLDSIAVQPPAPSVALGHKEQFAAIGTLSDGTTVVLTTQVLWSTSVSTIATISNAPGSQGLASTLLLGPVTVSATKDGVIGSTLMTVTDPVLDSITVAPTTANVIPGGKQQYTATGTLSDGTPQDLTMTAVWTPGNAAIATVSSTGLATGVAVGTTTIVATSQGVTGMAAIVVLGPGVTVTFPRDSLAGLRSTTPIAVTFDQAIDPTTLTLQTSAGACTGSLQLSLDNFATCVAFASAAPTMSVGNTVATASPATALQALTTYKIRVLGTVTNAAGGAGVAFTQPNGFTTATGTTCAKGLVISQVYGGGGNTGSVFRNDFIELHNGGATPVDLTGLAVQFVSAGGTGNWAVQALPSVSVPAGGYFLVQEAVGASTTVALLPTPDFVPTTPVAGGIPGFAMGATSGKIALTPSTTPLTGTSCATILSLSLDLVGYGAGLSCSEGTGTSAPANPTGVLRNNGGCDDANANSLDFTVGTPVPRNGATTANVCTCPAGLTGDEESNMSPAPDDGISQAVSP
jgi:uncharacterized protein YjdB